LGEGFSMGPVNDSLKAYMVERQGDIRYDIEWTTLREYLEYLVRRGVSCNVASFVGAGGVRANVLGFADRRPTAEELARMEALVKQAMAGGAVGLSAALIYAPDSYADTAELIALARAAAEYDGLFAAHLRSEGETFLEALDEFLTIVPRVGHPRRNLPSEGVGPAQLAQAGAGHRPGGGGAGRRAAGHGRYVHLSRLVPPGWTR
jgi:N-acyl-D-amino-acid deacylase